MAETSPTYTDDEMDLDKKYGASTPAVADTVASPSIYDMVNDKGTTKDLADLQRKKVSETEAFTSAEDRALAEDRTRAVNFLDREGVGPDDLKKWDVKHEREKYRTDPIESFGSLASVFAITAAAFTKAPMENALNGAAAAMNAVREGNEKEYEKAYQAWKDNNDLAIKRHNMMHTNYMDALNLMTHDVTLGDAKMRQIAARYGDQQALTLLDHGYAPQLIEMIQSRAKAMEGLQKVQEHSDEYTIRKAAYDADVKANPKMSPSQQWELFQRRMGIKTTDEQQWNQLYWEAHPPTGDPQQDYESWKSEYKKFNESKYPYRGQANLGSKSALVISKYNAIRAKNPDMPEDVALDMANREAEEATTKRTGTTAEQQTVDKKAAEYKADDPSLSDADAQIKAKRFVKLATSTPSGNRIDQLRGRADQIKYADERIDEVERMLKRHKAITGLGGKLLGRPTEIMGNILGSNSTDYKQFERTINELQLLMPRILTDSSGRPLGVEASHVGQIVAGLNAGDTLQGTMRNFQELKKQLAEMERDTQKRIQGGGGGERDQPAAPTTPKAGGTQPWLNDPVVQ